MASPREFAAAIRTHETSAARRTSVSFNPTHPLTAAIRKGNPNAVVAYNDGVKEYFAAYGRSADFTAGEFNDFYAVPRGRFVDGQQAFALIPLGAWTQNGDGAGWCNKGMKISAEKLVQYIRTVNERGGVVAVDIRINPDSSWEEDQFEALKALQR